MAEESSLRIRDWPGLPTDLLESIFQTLDNDLKSCLSFSAVCKQWRLLTVEKGQNQIPGIMLMAHDEEHLSYNNIGNIFSLASSNNSYKTYRPTVVEEEEGIQCYGSTTNGLFIMVDIIKSGRIFLLNPVSGKEGLVQCPSVHEANKKEQGNVNRVDIFGNVDEDYLVVVFRVTSRLLHFCRRGETTWTKISMIYSGVQSVGYHGGKLYAVSVSGTIEVFDTDSSLGIRKSIIKVRQPRREALRRRFHEVKHLDVPFKNEDGWVSHIICLVETPEGELLMTIQLVEFYDTYRFTTKGFSVFKLVESDWIQVESLGEWVLFVGMKSMCLKAHDVPGCQANSIYFTSPKDWNDMGVFNMKDKSVKPFYENCPFNLSPVTWFKPSLQQLG